MQSTASHWTVMLDEVTSDTLTEVGAADGTVQWRVAYLNRLGLKELRKVKCLDN